MRRLINDPRVCTLLPVGNGYRAFFCGEERLLGSRHFAGHGGVPWYTQAPSGSGMDFTVDPDSRIPTADFFIASHDVSRESARQVYDSICAVERSGVSGVLLESLWVREAGTVCGRDRIAATALIQTAVRSRWDPDFLICVRVHSRGRPDYASLVDRLNECANAGADFLFFDGPILADDLRRLVKNVPKPLCVDFSRAPLSPIRHASLVLCVVEGSGVAAAVLPRKRDLPDPDAGSPIRAQTAKAKAELRRRNRVRRRVTQAARRPPLH